MQIAIFSFNYLRRSYAPAQVLSRHGGLFLFFFFRFFFFFFCFLLLLFCTRKDYASNLSCTPQHKTSLNLLVSTLLYLTSLIMIHL